MPAVVLTEGAADVKFISTLIESNGLNSNEFVFPVFDEYTRGGVQNLNFKIRDVRSSSDPSIRKSSAVIIVADNDNAPKRRFDAVVLEINKANEGETELFGVPDKPRVPAQNSQSLPPVHILMVPWDDEVGCMETLCIQSADESKFSKEIKCSENFANCMEIENWKEGDSGLPDIARQAKFRVKSIMACVCPDPYTPTHMAWHPPKCPPVFQLRNPKLARVVEYLRSFMH